MKKRNFKKIRFAIIVCVIIISIILMIYAITRITVDNKNCVAAIDTIESIDKYDNTGKVTTFYVVEQSTISISSDGNNVGVSLLLQAHTLNESGNGCYVHYAVLNGYDDQVYEDKVWLPIIPDGHDATLQFDIPNIHSINDTDYSLIKIKGYSIEEQSE